MKSCINCQYAAWRKTDAGRLHPSGDGRCTYPYQVQLLPASMYWVARVGPIPNGGSISRKEELREHCVYFLRKEGT